MKSYCQKDQEAIEEDFTAQLTVAVSQDGGFIFGCDWEPTETGIKAIASIFYGVAHGQLVEQILSHLNSQCVLEGNEEDFLSILTLIQQLKLVSPKGDSEQAIAIPPRNALRM